MCTWSLYEYVTQPKIKSTLAFINIIIFSQNGSGPTQAYPMGFEKLYAVQI